MSSIFFRFAPMCNRSALKKARFESILELDQCIDSLKPVITTTPIVENKPIRKVVKLNLAEQEKKETLLKTEPIIKHANVHLPFYLKQPVDLPPPPPLQLEKSNSSPPIPIPFSPPPKPPSIKNLRRFEELNCFTNEKDAPSHLTQDVENQSSELPFPIPPPPKIARKNLTPTTNADSHPKSIGSNANAIEKKTPPSLVHVKNSFSPNTEKTTTEPKRLLPAGMISLLSCDRPQDIFLALNKQIGEVIQETLNRNTSCGSSLGQAEIIYLERSNEITKWSPERSVQNIILAIDNEGHDTAKNKEIYSLVSSLLRKKVTLKIALPRTEQSHEKRTFEELCKQKKGASRCAKSLKSACVIENTEEFSNIHLPIQTILQKITEKKELSLIGIPSKESIEQRKNAAILIYEKGEPVDRDNIVAVNLQLRGISFVPPTFRAAMLSHPDKTEDENNGSLQTKDQTTGLLSAIKREANLEDRIVFYDRQYWTITTDERWDSKDERMPLLVTLRLTNPKKSLLIQICNHQAYVDHRKIESPEQSILVRDFKLFTRVIPYYDEKGVLTGVERTFLGSNGKQPSKQKWRTKLARGVTSGASSSFFGSRRPKYKILAEGSENVLSALEVARSYPKEIQSLGIVIHEDQEKCNCQFTAALGVSDLVKVPIQESVRTIFLIADIDGYNMETKQTMIDTVDAFLQRGLNVKILFAPAKILGQKRDLNDVLREEGLEAAKEIFLDPVEITSKEDLGPANEILQLSLTAKKLKNKLLNAPFEKRPEILYLLGEVFSNLENWNQSLDCFSQALEGASKELKVKIQYRLALIWLKKRNPERAMDYFNQSLVGRLELKSDSRDLDLLSCLEGISKCHAEQKSYDLASTLLSKIFDTKVKLWKSDQHVGLGPLFYEFGNLEFKQGNWTKALFYFQKALDLKTKEIGSRNHLFIADILEKIGDIYFAQKQYNEAIESYRISNEIINKIYASDRHHFDSEILMKIAKSYHNLNLISNALEYFRKSLSQGKISAPTILHLLLRRAQQIEQGKQNPISTIQQTHLPVIPAIPILASNLATSFKINILKERAKLMRQVVLDLEMTGTGLKTDRITDIGCVVLKNCQKTDEVFQRYVNPGCRVRPEAHRLTGLTQRFLSQFPDFKDVASDFLAFINDSDLIIHAANNDIQFLTDELKAIGIEYDFRKKHQIIDTLEIAKILFPNMKNSLDALNTRLNINQSRIKHGALIDAEITAKVYLSMLSIETLLQNKR